MKAEQVRDIKLGANDGYYVAVVVLIEGDAVGETWHRIT